MQLKARVWLAGLAALAASAAIVPPAMAKESPQAVRIGTFTGAYLAGRVAESDDDLDNAIAYYKQALAFDADNQSLQQSLMLSLIARGRFDESLPYAEKLKTVAEVERVSRLALAVDSMRKKDYRSAQNWLQLALESDLDRLIVNVMAAWAKAGEGKPQDALDLLDKLQGPDWYAVFTSYHRALIADAADLKDKAEAAYSQTLDNVGGGSRRAGRLYAGGRILCDLSGPRQPQGRRAGRSRSRRRVRSEPPAADGSAGKDQQGRAGRAHGLDPGRRLVRNAAQSRRGAQPWRRRAIRAALPAAGASTETQQRRRLDASGRGSRTAGGCAGGDRSLSAHTGQFAVPAPLRYADRPEPCRSGQEGRSGSAAEKADRGRYQRHARLSGAGRRLCLEGGLPLGGKPLRRGGSQADSAGPHRLEYLLPARHRL